MIEVRNEIRNFCLYSEDGNHRYLLARIWDEKKSIPLFISKCSGEAGGIQLELTNTLITNNLYAFGYGENFYALAQKSLNFSNKFIPQIIEYARCEEQEAEHIMEYTFLGWKNNKFSALSEKNREYIGDLKLSQSDDYDYKGLNKLLKNAYGLQLALTVSCSSCLLGYLGQNRSFDSPIIHFYSYKTKQKR